MRYVLTIAGSDSCGGAGMQADIKTITSLGAHAMTALTAVTAQNSQGVIAIHEIPERFISIQVETLVEDLFPDSVKTGMLPTGSAVKEVAGIIKKNRFKRVVVDPVMRASTGRNLLDASTVPMLKDLLLPVANVVTPNLDEAGVLINKKIRNLNDMEEAAKEIKGLGPDVVVTGGHLEGKCVDLFYDGKKMHHFHGSKIETKNTHGSGCVFSTSLATFLALDNDVVEAVRLAHDFTRHAIEKGYPCGHGAGVVNPCTF
ncbi:bifunctional hydroxymethylpyrimidine kinase/phosphomethylpyrimidine kinase [Thermodesulfobacteriota bacterium]